MLEAVRAYIESRDYGNRRREAEHVAFMAHELRSPITAGLLGLQHLGRRGPAGVADAPQFAVVERNLHRLEELIAKALENERVYGGELLPQRVCVPWHDVLQPIVTSARPAAERKGLELRVRYPPQAEAKLDVQLTGSALQNLAENAIKYTEHGYVELTIEEGPREVTAHVRDSCGGIPARELRSIFEPFRRGEAHARKPGSGLGLAIARRAIEAQGGTIEVESFPGVGCHFWFTLPKNHDGAHGNPVGQ
jgi:signal transduction histidine kinase